MKRYTAILLMMAMILSCASCGSTQGSAAYAPSAKTAAEASLSEDSVKEETEAGDPETENEETGETESTETEPETEETAYPPVPPEEAGDDSPYEDTISADDPSDPDFLRYVENEAYQEIVTDLSDRDVYVQGVRASYISKEFIDELTYNSKQNVFFGYTLKELDQQFTGTRYVFTLSGSGETVVIPVQNYDINYEEMLKTASIAAGVVLVTVVITVMIGESPEILAAVQAIPVEKVMNGVRKYGPMAAAIVSLAAGEDIQEYINDVKTEIEDLAMNAVGGVVDEAAELLDPFKEKELNGLTEEEAKQIQQESGYPLDVIASLDSMEEYEVLKKAELKPVVVNGRNALIRGSLDTELLDMYGRTNLERMGLGLPALDEDGQEYEVCSVNDEEEGTLVLLTEEEIEELEDLGFKALIRIGKLALQMIIKNLWKFIAAWLLE